LDSWVDRQRAESLFSLYDVCRSKASSREHFRQAALRLPRIGGETERNAAARLEDPSHLSQPSPGIRPDLHGVNRQSFIEALVCKWQVLHRAMPQVDPTTLDRLRIPSGGLRDHCLRIIHAGNISR